MTVKSHNDAGIGLSTSAGCLHPLAAMREENAGCVEMPMGASYASLMSATVFFHLHSPYKDVGIIGDRWGSCLSLEGYEHEHGDAKPSLAAIG